MTREEAKNWLNKLYVEADITDEYGDMVDMQPYSEAVDMAIEALEQTRWIPFTKRPMTDEEREYYREWSDVEGAEIFDCPLPENGQEVLVSYGGYVCVDVFCKDDGCYFEGVDIDDVQAWMPLPQPYKGESEE